MKKVIKGLFALLISLYFVIPAVAVEYETERIGGRTPIDTLKQSEENSNVTEISEPKKNNISNAGVEGNAIFDEFETERVDSNGNIVAPPPPADGATRTYNEVRSVVGNSVEIINIDGLDVPLADGSSVYIPFVDIAKDAYYAEAVAWAYQHDPQITAGVTELSFGPNQTCTRGQMVTFLWRAAGCPEPTGTASAFSDVTAGAYYEKAVAWAVENKITDGVGDGRFDPNGIVNRAQAVTFLYRAKGAPEATASESFTDVPAGEYYADAVAWAVANGITNGMGDGAFAPANSCVRGQTVTFLYRAYK